MSDTPLTPTIGQPAPWGPRPLGSGQGLQRQPEPPKLEDMTATLEPRVKQVEADVRTLMIAFGAAFVVLILAFGGGYLALSAQQSASTERLATKLDSIGTQLSDVKTGVAVLEERTKPDPS